MRQRPKTTDRTIIGHALVTNEPSYQVSMGRYREEIVRLPE